MPGRRGDVEQPQTPQPRPGGRHDQVHRGILGEAVPFQVRHGVKCRAGGLVCKRRHDPPGEGGRQAPDHGGGHGRDFDRGRRIAAPPLQQRARLAQLLGLGAHRLDNPAGRRVLGRAFECLLYQRLGGQPLRLGGADDRVHHGDRHLRHPAREPGAHAPPPRLRAQRSDDREQEQRDAPHRPTGLTISSAFWRPKPSLT